LDFGCGFGTFAEMLAERYPNVQVYGIDLDREKIDVGRQRYKPPNLYLLHSNRIIGKYDSMTAFFSFHEIADIKKALNNLYEHLSDNGKILTYDFRKTTKAKYREWYEKGNLNRDFEEEYLKHNRWTLEEFEQMCEESGFETIKTEPAGDYWLLFIGIK